MQKGMTAIHHAVKNGHLSAVKVLIEDCQCQLGLKAEVSVCSSQTHMQCVSIIMGDNVQSACTMCSIIINVEIADIDCALSYPCTVMHNGD